MELLALDTGIVGHDADTSATQDMVVGRGRRRGGRKSTAGSDDESDLVAWLDGLGLGKYSRIFVRQEVDFGTLAELTADDLREMGITALGPRKKLAAAISALRTMGKGKYSTSELCVAAPGPAPRLMAVWTSCGARLAAHLIHMDHLCVCVCVCVRTVVGC